MRGFIAAFDAKTGAQAWKFYTVPGPGDKDPGLIKAAATWPKNIVGGGGGSVWDAISYDPDLELVYFGTGNAGPWSEDARVSKGFDLLYAASIVAVDVNTGLYRWHYQNVPGDEWDFDSVQHLLLADVTIKGVKRKVIMQANKNGFLYTHRPHQRQVYFGYADRQGQLGAGPGRSDGPADHQSGRQVFRDRIREHHAGSGRSPQLVADELQSDAWVAVCQRPVGRRLYLRRAAEL